MRALKKAGSTLMRSWGKTRSFSIDLYKGLAQHCLLASFIKYNRCCNHVIFVLDGFSRSANAEYHTDQRPALVAAGCRSDGAWSGISRWSGIQANHHFSRLPKLSLVRNRTPAPNQSKQGWRRGWRVFFYFQQSQTLQTKPLHPGYIRKSS